MGSGMSRQAPRSRATLIGPAMRDGGFDDGANRSEVVWQLVGAEVRANGHQAAADVDANGGRDDGSLGGNDTADGGPDAPMDIRHGGDPLEDERKLSDVEELLAGLVLHLDASGPRFDGDSRIGQDDLAGGGFRHEMASSV